LTRFLFFAFLYCSIPFVSFGASFAVNITSDTQDANPGDGVCSDPGGNCSIRAAIMEANALPGADVINIPGGVYLLSIAGSGEDLCLTGDFDINSEILITGASAVNTILNGDSLDRVFHILNAGVVDISGIEIREGFANPGNGGGILNEGVLNLLETHVSENACELNTGGASAGGFGGGVSNEGTLTIDQSTIFSNTSRGGRGNNGVTGGGGGGSSPGFGGGIYNGPLGSITMVNSTVSGNQAIGGARSSGSGNGGSWGTAGRNGAHILFGVGGAAGGGNGTGGGQYAGGGGGGSQASAPGSGGIGGYGAGGGGARAGGGTGGIGGNGGFGGGNGGQACCSSGAGGGAGAGFGGGIFNDGGTFTVNNSTIAFNEAIGGAGSAGNGGWTQAGQSGSGIGGGVFNRSGTFDLSVSIVGANSADFADTDINGTLTSTNGYNLIENLGSVILGGTTTGNITGVSPMLIALADNGGPTWTHALQLCPNSPAIDAGTASGSPILDQREFPRVSVYDIGAYESDALATVDLATDSLNATCGLSNGSAIIIPIGATPYVYVWDAAAGNQTTSIATGLGTGIYQVTVTDANNCVQDTTVFVNVSAPFAITTDSTLTSCGGADGTASAIVTGGTTPIQYLWTGGQTNLVATGLIPGVYDVTVTDNLGCVGYGSTNVIQPSAITVTTSSSIEMCNTQDGTATISASGGGTSYSYLWDVAASSQTTASASGLSAGSYQVTVYDSNSCSQLANVTIGTSTVTLTVIESVTDVGCYQDSDGTVSIIASGGLSPYNYLWDNGTTSSSITGLAAGEYFYSITDANGCELSTSVTGGPTPISGCVQITSILVDACTAGGSNEWDDEMVFFTTGSTALDTANLTVTWNSLPWQGLCPNPLWIANVNASITGGGMVMPPPGGSIPPNSQVLLITSNNATMPTMSLVDLSYTLYVVFQCADPANTQGHFGNYNASGGVRTLGIDFGIGCSDNVSYDRDLLLNQTGGFGGTSADKDGAFVSFDALGVITYGNEGCIAPFDTITYSNSGVSVSITQPSAVSVTIAVTANSCAGYADGTATASVVGGTSGYTYLWNNSQTDGSVSGLSQGIGTTTIYDSNLCSIATTYTITEPIALSVTMNQTDLSCNLLCDGQASVVPFAGTTPYTYLWTSGFTGSISTGLCAQIETVTVTDLNNCTISEGVTLTEPSSLSITFQSSDVLCSGGNDGFSVVVASGGAGTTYIYSWGGGIASTNPFAGNLSAGTYSLTVTDGNGCELDTSNFVISQPNVISVTAFSISPSNCSLLDGSLAIGGVIGGTGSTYSYAWDNGQTNAAITGLLDGQYCLTITDQAGCSEGYCAAVPAIAGPFISTQGSAVNCNGECNGSATVTAFSNGGSNVFTYAWGIGTGGQVGSPAIGLCVGIYNVTATDQNGCSAVSVTNILETPIVNRLPYIYTWDIGVGSIQNVCPSSMTLYQVTATDANGCESAPGVIQVDVLPLIAVLASVDTTICEEAEPTISAFASGGNGGPYTYVWDNGIGFGNPVTVSPVSYPSPTNYVVTVSDGCSPNALDTVTISYYVTPAPLFSTTDYGGCQPFTTNIFPIGSSIPNISSCTWQMEDGTIYTGCDSIYHTFMEVGTHDVTLAVVSNDGCSNAYALSSLINVFELPEANFTSSPNPTDLYNTQVQFEDVLSPLVNQWHWTFYDIDTTINLGTSAKFNPFIEYPAIAGSYPVNLEVGTVQGCFDDTTGFIVIEPVYAFYIPNAFTPNSNGLNETFYPVGLSIVEADYNFMIFDRWGKLLFQTNDLSEGWDGKHKNELVPNDVYAWRIELRKDLTIKDKIIYQGHVTIIY